MRLHEIISEAVKTIPVTKEEFRRLEELLEMPLMASEALGLIGSILSDDGLNDSILAEAERDPKADVRALIIQWIELNMPQQLESLKTDPRMGGNQGIFSPLHGENIGEE